MDDRKKKSEFWLSLPNSEKKKRLVKAYTLVKAYANSQIVKIDKSAYDYSEKDIRHAFVFSTVKEAWNDLDFLFSFSKKSKWNKKAYYPMRSVFDKMAKLAYFTYQTVSRQKELARHEYFASLKKYYSIGLRQKDKEFCDDVKASFNRIKEKNDPEITDGKKAFRKGMFPNIKRCLTEGRVKELDALYSMYEDASQLSHGNFAEIIIKQSDDSFFLRSAEAGLHFANEILRGTDFHLHGSVSKEAEQMQHDYQSILYKGFDKE